LDKVSDCGLGQGTGAVLEDVGYHEKDERVASVDLDGFEFDEA
jgi:hypothetical protein